MNSEHHDQAPGRLHRSRMRRGFAFTIVMLIAGCSGGGGGSQDPPQNPPQSPVQAVSGLDARPSNATCVAPERATGSATIGTERAFPNLIFRSQPVAMLQAPG